MFSNQIRYLFLLVFVGIISILYNQYVMGILFLCVLFMPIIQLLLIIYLSLKIKVKLSSVIHVATKEETIPITIQIHNPTIFPLLRIKLYLTYKNAYSSKEYKKEIITAADNRGSTSIACNIRSEYTGNLEISLKQVRFYDYIKLLSLKKKNKSKIRVAVLPLFHEIEEVNLSYKSRQLGESDHYSRLKGGDDPSEVFAIREYREGDRFQRVHWKLSSKMDQLMIKEFSDPLNCSVLIMLDLWVPQGKDRIAYIDALLECSLSLSHTLLTRGQHHYFSWFDIKQGKCRRIRVTGEKDLYEAADGLLDATVYQDTTNMLPNYLAEYTNEQYTDLFYVTGENCKETAVNLSMIQADKKEIIHIKDRNHELRKEEVLSKEGWESYEELSDDMAKLGIGTSFVFIERLAQDIQNLNLC